MTVCRTPEKGRYTTRNAALEAAHRAGHHLGKPLYPYDTCRCGQWHLTSTPPTPPTPTNPNHPPCPTPWRRGHPTQQDAEHQRDTDRFRHNAAHHPYKCRCLLWHLTPRLEEELPTYQQPDPANVHRLTQLDHDTFAALVDADVKKTAPTSDRLALRHPDNLTRWRWTLKSLHREVRRQLAAGGTPAWLERTRTYESTLTARLRECQQLRTYHQKDNAA